MCRFRLTKIDWSAPCTSPNWPKIEWERVIFVWGMSIAGRWTIFVLFSLSVSLTNWLASLLSRWLARDSHNLLNRQKALAYLLIFFPPIDTLFNQNYDKFSAKNITSNFNKTKHHDSTNSASNATEKSKCYLSQLLSFIWFFSGHYENPFLRKCGTASTAVADDYSTEDDATNDATDDDDANADDDEILDRKSIQDFQRQKNPQMMKNFYSGISKSISGFAGHSPSIFISLLMGSNLPST